MAGRREGVVLPSFGVDGLDHIHAPDYRWISLCAFVVIDARYFWARVGIDLLETAGGSLMVPTDRALAQVGRRGREVGRLCNDMYLYGALVAVSVLVAGCAILMGLTPPRGNRNPRQCVPRIASGGQELLAESCGRRL